MFKNINSILVGTFCCMQVYRKRTEAAKKLYLKQLATYRASLLAKVAYLFMYLKLSKYIEHQNHQNVNI